MFTQDKTLTSKTNVYNQKISFPIYLISKCLICDSILIIKKLNLKNAIKIALNKIFRKRYFS